MHTPTTAKDLLSSTHSINAQQQHQQQQQQQQHQQLIISNISGGQSTNSSSAGSNNGCGSNAKKPRLVFTDLQRRTLQAIFRDTKRPSKDMQITISQQLGLDLSTVGNFFMNARRRSQDKWLEDTHNSNSNTCSSLNANDYTTNNGLSASGQGHLMGGGNFSSNCSSIGHGQPSNAMSSIMLNNTSNSVLNSAGSMLQSNGSLANCGLNSKLITNSSNSNCSSQSSLASPSSTTSPHLTCKFAFRAIAQTNTN